ncbi:hypothetical protein BJV82DRAFT_608751 [Fennellomyces sp. T-0311]|nr:hypothetical protein BJV82DRAFT_608751 [Fennellomyces sp. T-0311]
MAREDPNLKAPTMHWVMNYESYQSNHIPQLEMTTIPKIVSITRRNAAGVAERLEEVIDLHIYKPSEVVKHLIANPRLSKHLSALPDRSPNASTSLTQGEKWKTCPLFQHPMVSTSNGDLWVGDFVVPNSDPYSNILYKLVSFYTNNGCVMADACIAFRAQLPSNHHDIIALSKPMDVNQQQQQFQYVPLDLDGFHLHPQNNILQTLDHYGYVALTNGAIIYDNVRYDIIHHTSIFEARYRCMPASGQCYRKVRVVPINLFSDDTSGNTTKKWNKFDSWSMVPAALPLDERNKRENTFLLCVHKRLSAINMLEEIVRDVRQLEDGMIMYDAVNNEEVLVISPLNFIIGDNARHSELACHKGARANFPCRKCFYSPKTANPNVEQHSNLTYRTKEDIIALTTDNAVSVHSICLPNGQTSNSLDALSFKKTGSEILLDLRSFDQTMDLPIEILHSLMLGVTKYLVYSMIKYLNAVETSQLQTKLRTYNSKAFGRVMGSCLRVTSMSFVGRDFKIMSQQLPIILNDLLFCEWSGLAIDRRRVLEGWLRCFTIHGELISLVYMGQIQYDYDQYIDLIDTKVKALTVFVTEIESMCATVSNTGPRIISETSKLHILHHLKDDLSRFAPAIHYESEKGEQFNKFIREHIQHTNRHNPSRDVLTLFGRQFMFRHIIDGGFWADKKSEERISAGDGILDYMDNHPEFGPIYLGGDRQFTDNNSSLKEFKKGLAAFFLDLESDIDSNPLYILALIEDIVEEDGSKYVHLNVYEPIRYIPNQTRPLGVCQFPTSIYSSCIKDPASNLIVTPSNPVNISYPLESIRMEEVVDLQPCCSRERDYVINASKFGTLWYMLQRDIQNLYMTDLL